MGKMSPTARTIKRLKAEGWAVAVVEKKVPYTFTSVDLFGIGDLLAMRAGEPLVLIQCTSGANVSSRRRKSLASPHLATWLSTGARFVVHGWARQGKAGYRKLWVLRVVELTVADVEEARDEAAKNE